MIGSNSKTATSHTHKASGGKYDGTDFKHAHNGGVKIRTTVMTRDPKNKLKDEKPKVEVEKMESPKAEKDEQFNSNISDTKSGPIASSPGSPGSRSKKGEPDVGQAYLNAILVHNDERKDKKQNFVKELSPVLKKNRHASKSK